MPKGSTREWEPLSRSFLGTRYSTRIREFWLRRARTAATIRSICRVRRMRVFRTDATHPTTAHAEREFVGDRADFAQRPGHTFDIEQVPAW